MRRALVLVAVVAAALLAAVPVLAPAAPAGREVERELAFALNADGFPVQVVISNNDGDVNAILFLRRGPRIAYYSAPAKVTAERVTARFGRLGELDYTFKSRNNESIECLGAEPGEAIFEGTFTFTGENGYVHIDADHAHGSFQVYPEPVGCPQARRARHVVPYRPAYSREGATLNARVGSRAQGAFREIFAYDLGARARHRGSVFGIRAEKSEGLTVVRGIELPLRSSAFHVSLANGTATLRPPAPFTGSATFTRHGDEGHGTWRGSLAMPILGGEPVKLAGGNFRAYIHKGVPQDE